ncbi:hypothetical protein ACIREE_18425 [Streptomyces sp. NPDC102467]|uniref:hypothetical protein n=1 Tax=Streptomyces sp. NPDC102467 TaxID=3366179 RepID=UPI0038259D94
MIRLTTTARIKQLEHDARAAYEHARQTSGAANEAFGQHVRELFAATDRAERAETATSEVATLLAGAVAELAAAQEDLLLKDIAIRLLREELERGPAEGDSLTVLLHYGKPHTVYRSREDACADTAVHGVAPDAVWVPSGERPAAACKWRVEAFIYDAGSNGFRRAFMPAPEPVGGVA